MTLFEIELPVVGKPERLAATEAKGPGVHGRVDAVSLPQALSSPARCAMPLLLYQSCPPQHRMPAWVERKATSPREGWLT